MPLLSLMRATVSSALLLSAAVLPLAAQTAFSPVAPAFAPVLRAEPAEGKGAIHPGGKVVISGEKLIPGQKVTLMRGPVALSGAEAIPVDAEGRFRFELTLEAEAAGGLHPVVVIAEAPAGAKVLDVKISPELPLFGAETFEITSAPAGEGLYQVVADPASGGLWVAAAVGRPPVRNSALTRLDVESLKTLATATPPAAPAGKGPDGSAREGGVFAIYGLDHDATHARLWVSNTRQNTIAVYDARDLSLVKQFPAGTVHHSRDLRVDEVRGRVYASATFTNRIEVFDSESLTRLDPIEITSNLPKGEWSSMALDLDAQSGVLVNVSMRSDELAVVDLTSGAVRVHPLPGAKGASGVAYDPVARRAYVVSQQSDNLLIVDIDSGAVLKDIYVGAQPLNVTFEPVSRRAFIANRGAGTIAVVSAEGDLIANLDGGSRPNQLRADGTGTVWAVNKSLKAGDPRGNLIWRIRPAP